MDYFNNSLDFPENITENDNISEIIRNNSLNTNEIEGCPVFNVTYDYESIIGVKLSVPEWEAVLTLITLSAIILLTIVGNILVILSVFTYKPLRIVQNFFIVSLAVADLTVAILVLPLNVAYSLIRRWVFGIHICKMWLTCDVLCCTASILNLCAIALDRYWAITDPINYAQKRTLKRVLIMIGGVWVLSLLISSPPLAGWNDWPEEFDYDTPCMLTSQQGYVIYSSLGSFYIPLLIMTLVYIEIFIATKRRLRERAKASRFIAVKQNITTIPISNSLTIPTIDCESVSSENNHDNNLLSNCKKGKKKHKKGSVERKRQECLSLNIIEEDSVTDISHMNQQNDETVSTNLETPSTTNTIKTISTPDSDILKKNTVYQFIEEKQRISLSKERRAARTLGIIMGVFVVCWLPFFLMYVILPFCPTCCPSDKLINFITWLGYINSALNPIIYTIFNLDFRRAFKKLLHLKP